ncbi:conserved hypothetical protein [Ricinus communis]|uniref:Uncharacterized protein n=1 Tax=Ricinus communis TaxID=3988 RepID=B9S5X1_RICCO|nr:conserved hypothetical protein [Ricinus communis]
MQSFWDRGNLEQLWRVEFETDILSLGKDIKLGQRLISKKMRDAKTLRVASSMERDSIF